MASDYTKIILDNGLVVLLKEIHTSPIISHWIWYQVGSRNEVPGITGASHWVEHMLFKGTDKFPSGKLDKAISREGGYWNAMTYIDWTTYFATMPADKIDLILQVEADRMRNAHFLEADVDSERSVIISERQGNENSPMFRMDEEIQAAAFRVHSYHHQVIGDMPDLENMRRDDLVDHYKKYYIPNNAVLTIAGDFKTKKMLKRIRELFGQIPAGEIPNRNMRTEPEQKGERRINLEGPGETAFVRFAYRAPMGDDKDFFSLMILDSLLTGASSLNMFGGGISNKTSR
ncbi:MAG: insulinase family protein, partial [Chloroflexota bacterium]